VPLRRLVLNGAALAATALGAVALAGCGSVFGSGGKEGTTGSSTRSTEAKVPKSAKPLEVAKPNESVQDAEKQIAKLSASNCRAAYRLNPISTRSSLNNQSRCRQLQGLAGLTVDHAATYKGGAVIDYALGIRTLSVILVRDQDGALRVATPDYFLADPSVGTKVAPQFDQAALKAVNALRTHDCTLFLRYASQELGPASVGKKEACDFAKNNPVADVFGIYSQANVQRLGGNANIAFYGIGTPYTYYTLVFTKETPSDYFPQGQSLTKDAPTYAYSGIYLTGQSSPKNSKNAKQSKQ
jgi:hypothetical protein